MAQTLKFGKGTWATKTGSSMAYNDQNGNYKPLPFNVERDSIATRVNKEGLIEVVGKDKLRIDYKDSAKGVALLEPSRSNIVLHSQELNNAYWVVSPATFVTANEIISPDGTLNADKVSETTFNGVHQIYSAPIATTISVSNTYSVFAKKAERNWIKVQNGSTSQANFNLEDGTIGTVVGGTTAEIEDYGNGWYRCKISFIASSSLDRFYVRIMTSDNVISYTGDGISGVYLWGAMAEVGSYATSYIPTSGSTYQRQADVVNGSGNSEVFNDSEGILFAEISALVNDSSTRVITISDGTSNERVQLFYIGSNQIASNVTDGGVGQASMISSVNILNNNKFAFKYKLNDLALWSNGFKVSVDTIATMPTGLNTLSYDNGIGASVFYGKTKQIQYYDEILTDAELEYMTSYRSLNEMVTELNLNAL